MIQVSIYTTQILEGELSQRLGARFTVRDQEIELLEGDGRLVQVGLPVFSERYGRQIDFDADGEEWARNLPYAYRNGSISAESEEIVEQRPTRRYGRVPALADGTVRGARS
jgi:hypothetical protein